MIDIAAIQKALCADGIDGWLLYDFHGSNPIARKVVQLDSSQKLTTRRWYYLIPAQGEPRALMHVIEPTSLAHLPGKQTFYTQHEQLQNQLQHLVTGCKTVAMEYSPNGAIPYISRIDAGTVDAIRKFGLSIVSSGDLVQRFEAVWDHSALESHQTASESLYRVKDQAFGLISHSLSSSTPILEFEVQQAMVEWFNSENLITDSPPVVAFQKSTGNPHYMPTVQDSRPLSPDDLILIDLWGKLDAPHSVFADITWMAYAGPSVPPEYAATFSLVREARDAAVTTVKSAVGEDRELRGWQVDRAARNVIEKAKLGAYFVHRTGHSLGEVVHGNGVHMDDYETRDDRRLLPGTGFTIEPGIYYEDYGIRTEINMYIGKMGAQVTGPMQTEIVTLGAENQLVG